MRDSILIFNLLYMYYQGTNSLCIYLKIAFSHIIVLNSWKAIYSVENIWYTSLLYIIPSWLTFYQSYNTRRYPNESERSRDEVHVLIIKSIIIFRYYYFSSTARRRRAAPIFFPFFVEEARPANGSRENLCGIGRASVLSKRARFLSFTASSNTHSRYLDLFDLAYRVAARERPRIENSLTYVRRSCFCRFSFVTTLDPNTKIHEIRPFNAGIPCIVVFG